MLLMTSKKIKHNITFIPFSWKWPENLFELTNIELIYLTLTQKSTINLSCFYPAHLITYIFHFSGMSCDCLIFVQSTALCWIYNDKLLPLFLCFSKNDFPFTAFLFVRQRPSIIMILFYKINTQGYTSDVIINIK